MVLFAPVVIEIRIQGSYITLDIYCVGYRGTCNNINNSKLPGGKGGIGESGEIIADRVSDGGIMPAEVLAIGRVEYPDVKAGLNHALLFCLRNNLAAQSIYFAIIMMAAR